ncbi:MAG: MTH1187 family thiamine-binding protein [Deltaproteobacteria bacterium]|nr:MTH1187 family thiamine-binding protein [Deltaproteobacteria bacterium]MBW1718650.1 MTH1187 family thiamine-binding protein [Deltaproteobacteria bacterium]MBW1932793.1 MTH1187 family thiamine-binding protein [Deltaproteobacteria bacterium]MBW1938400.1 MTH1187 family thiamine-binding protein [Deltaproteobacteria bacterium]MBW1964154.1 MTH1187 family thiamine-binding protein [Deltaproteobacteria bacterium]
MALMEINVSPLGTGSTSVGEFVVNMQRLLTEQGLPYELTDMGTIIEGDVDQLLAVAKVLHESTFSNGAKRVYTVIKIDDRRDKEVHLGQKTGSVKERI